jgi:hypothetical protein
VADCAGSHRIRVVATDGATSTLAGNGDAFHDDGPVATATFCHPKTVVAAPDDSIYVADANSIRKISTGGIVTTIAGSREEGNVDGPGNEVVSMSLLVWLSLRATLSSSVMVTIPNCGDSTPPMEM